MTYRIELEPISMTANSFFKTKPPPLSTQSIFSRIGDSENDSLYPFIVPCASPENRLFTKKLHRLQRRGGWRYNKTVDKT